MNVEILLKPGCSVAKVSLAAGETLTAEGGSMVAMSNDMQIQTSTHKKNQGGLLKAAKRLLSGESFFMNHYTPGPNGGDVYLSPTLLGDMHVQDLNNQKIIVQGGSFLCASHEVNVDFNFQGMKSLFSGEGFFWLTLSGTGKAVFNAFGAIYPVQVDGEYIVDSGHIVAFEETLTYSVTKAGSSWISSFMGGEGFVCKFKGKGTVWCQSHNPDSFGTTIGPLLKPRK
jgi:uncharacterized protein (TIGR00266 family)